MESCNQRFGSNLHVFYRLQDVLGGTLMVALAVVVAEQQGVCAIHYYA